MHHPPPPPGLADRSIADMRAFFERQSHHPSQEHWEALGDIATTLEDMADQAVEPKVFLSAIDPGVGKTQTVTHFARALAQDERYRDVGMIVCVGRIAEARALAGDLALPREQFAILTSDNDANALGNPDPAAAQILITTQQRIERACEGRTFAEADAFHYRRHGPRIVRVWDEAWLPGCTITVTGDDLLLLVKPIRAVSPAFAASLKRFASGLDDYVDGDVVDVPDFEAVHGVSLWDVLAAVSAREGRLRDDQHAAAAALRTLNGRRARVRTDGATGNTVLSYADTLPSDLAPLLVLDASGRVRETYRSLETHRGSIVRLREAVKDYSPLKVHVWRTSGSKSGFQRQGDALIAGIADTITTKPNEAWLVVTHKPSWGLKDVESRLRRRLGKGMTGDVQVITWGNHLATNTYADFPNVVLAGSLFMRQSHYTALTMLSQGADVAAGMAPAADVRTMKEANTPISSYRQYVGEGFESLPARVAFPCPLT